MTTTSITRRSAALPLTGVVAMAAGAALLLVLQVVPPTNQISALRRTISEYALSDIGWVFDLAVVLVALGSALGFGALIRQCRVPARSAATVFCALWTVGLLAVIAFPKHDWALGPNSSGSGTIHRAASVVAFVCLPICVLLAAKKVFPHTPRRRTLSSALALASLLWFAVILGAVAVAASSGGRWWELIPLGLVEPGMALTEVLALISLIFPAGRGVTAGPAGLPEESSTELTRAR
ncbi:DUF998 domain-containing protein [Amycolatopsis sp. H20-H5]|uniref:DUF998 domain-containing protein n=1 Tax=Amycolatopsis sp. H20-H5 TaxID=3046309 RepID=UPI002DB7CE82|nr:DUF998 domain-containing protein [Amycolatopsis sp. H20-H5]MEC3976093.1 DUF998 domain-containing protein [Amycolatopsis sp. H20-H5]